MVFMQDNPPSLDENNIETLNWPPQSPDMNPIETFWANRKVRRKKKYGALKLLITQIFDIWDNIEMELPHNLANSANKRIIRFNNCWQHN